MDLLLDTQVLVWLADGDKRLSRNVLRALADEQTIALVSAVTAFEYADLHARGRFAAGIALPEILRHFELEVVEMPHNLWRRVVDLPDIHRDPIDRMLIAHALALDVPLASADRLIRRYPVKVLW